MSSTPDHNPQRPSDPFAAIETMPASQARREWAQLLNRVQRDGAPVLIEKNGVPVAALISPHKLDFLLSEIEKRERTFAILHEVQAAFAHIPDDELEREIEKAIAEVRAENRARAAEHAHASAR